MDAFIKKAYSDINGDEKSMLLSSKRKYITLSFDDGVTQDIKFIEILNKYGIPCTFNINSELLGKPGELKWEAKSITHNKVTEAIIKNGLYNGHEVAVHTLTHPLLTTLSDEDIIAQVKGDSENIERIVGVKPQGMAYPCGGKNHDERVAEIISKNTDITYARTIISTYNFSLPKNYMIWNPTIWLFDERIEALTEAYDKTDAKSLGDNQLFYIWGHSYEFDFFDAWDRFDSYFKRLSEMEDVIFITNRVAWKLLG